MKNELIKARMVIATAYGGFVSVPIYYLHGTYEENSECLRIWALSHYKYYHGLHALVDVFGKDDDMSDPDLRLKDYSFVINKAYNTIKD